MSDTKKSTKKIDTVRVILKSEAGHKFEDILTSSTVDGREYYVKGKDVTLKILDNPKSGSYVIGIMETSRRFNIPPKKNKTQKKIQAIGLTRDEGLAYANIFVYDKPSKVLMYEVNKNGCYIDHFVDFIYKCCADEHSEFKSIDIKIETVLTINGYERIKNMAVRKSIEFSIARPSELIDRYNEKHGAIAENVRSGTAMHSDRVSAKFEVLMTGKAKHEGRNLAVKPFGAILKEASSLLQSPFRDNVEKVIVQGYESDSDDNKLTAVDLVSDRYIKHIQLDEPRENTDLLERQRETEIKALYQKCKKDFRDMFKD